MKIIVVLMGDVFKFPPILSLIHAFQELNIESVIVCTTPGGDISEINRKIVIENLDINYEKIKFPIQKLCMLSSISKKIWRCINRHYNNNSIIWVVSDVTIKYLGKRLLQKNYILHLLELSQYLMYYKKIPFLRMDSKKIGNSAKAVVVPEYNRAHIMQAWRNLKLKPYILPNKPCIDYHIDKMAVVSDPTAAITIKQIKDRKIILYQGILDSERPLGEFIKAVDLMGDEYAFVIMSGDENIYFYFTSNNYYFIPFVSPPRHLEITSHAYIGILSYVPTDDTGYSLLNSLYCAPNKIFEYSMFGIPMIGNDVPGLSYLFKTKNIGICLRDFTAESVIEAINYIENHYKELSENSLNYYNEVDYKANVKKIIDSFQ